jgi:histidinol-phosphate aminotransferase
VRDLSANPRLPGCLRLTVGTPEQNERLLAALERA